MSKATTRFVTILIAVLIAQSSTQEAQLPTFLTKGSLFSFNANTLTYKATTSSLTQVPQNGYDVDTDNILISNIQEVASG